MPRVPPLLLQRANRISPHLAALLPVCRTLPSARNELRWIREHVLSTLGPPGKDHDHGGRDTTAAIANGRGDRGLEAGVDRLVGRRSKGIPLQYVLGSQPFGHLDIRCRRGVLIPRPETEAWVCHLAGVVAGAWWPGSTGTSAGAGTGTSGRGRGSGSDSPTRPLRIVDFCSGSGCIALLLFALLGQRQQQSSGRGLLSVHGFDVSPRAVALARENLALNARRGSLPLPLPLPEAGRQVTFDRADVFAAAMEWRKLLGGPGPGPGPGPAGADILVANPPYISARGFDRDTGRAVRKYEPRRALVPPAEKTTLRAARAADWDGAPEDVFYARLLDVAAVLGPELVAFEVGDLDQGMRVVEMAMATAREGQQQQQRWDDVEIWRDWPDMRRDGDEAGVVRVGGRDVPVRGSGNGRVVFLRRKKRGAAGERS